MFLSFYAKAQNDTISIKNLIGVWQIGSSKTGSALNKHFQFFEDGRYILNFNQNDETKRIISLSGHYRFKDNKLYLTAEIRKEIVGGELIAGSPAFQLLAGMIFFFLQ